MAYRGEDLDLRTPPARSAVSGETSSSGAYLNGLRRADYGEPLRPILVDDVVLECCNYAHEIATAHRAGDVRLEHLVYAMTRVDAAIPILEDRGTRVIALRNDALNLIASAPQVSSKLTPRKSDDLEVVLRAAADLAARRDHAAASIDDVLIALVEVRPDHPGVVLLRRHMPRRVRETSYPAIRPEAPPLIREPERERTRVRVTTAPLPDPRGTAEGLLGSSTDSIQNSRIETLEQAVRQLSAQLTNERKSISLTLQDIQRDIGLRRDDDVRHGTTFGDRIGAIEASLDQRLGDLSRAIHGLGANRRDDDLRYDGNVIDRIASIEASIEQRLADLGRAFNTLQDRLQSVDAALSRRSDAPINVNIAPLQERLANVERLLQTSTGETSRGWATVADRIKTLEATLASGEVEFAGSSVDTTPLHNRLEAIETLLLERVSEPAGDGGVVAQRVKELETRLGDEIRRISGTLTQTSEGTERRFAQLFGTALERQRGELAGAIGSQLSERLSAVGGIDPARHLAPVSDRLGTIERNLSAYVQKVSEQTTSYDQDLGEIQDVLIKLHGHQQSINGALEQWRAQSTTDIGAIGTRLSAIERVAQRPAQMLETMSTRIDALYRLVYERVERRNRFVYWLFGTNDWLAASWPERRRAATTTTTPPPQA